VPSSGRCASLNSPLRPAQATRAGRRNHSNMARSRLLVAALAAIAVLAASAAGSSSGARQPAQTPAAATPTFVVSGRGWGHGVGLAQWGSQGFAQQGAAYDDILGHYYPGT